MSMHSLLGQIDLLIWLCVLYRFQQLELKHVENRGCFGAMEFR